MGRGWRWWAGGVLGVALAGAAPLSAQGSFREWMRPEALGGVVLTLGSVRQGHDLSPQSAVLLRERLGQLLAAAGFEGVGAETPYVLDPIVAVPPSRDPATVGFERRVTVVADVTLQLVHRPSNAILHEWTLQLPGAGRDRVEAIDNALRLVRHNATRYVEAARDARERVVRHVEQTCDELRTRAAAHAMAGRLSTAVTDLLLVPDVARGCQPAALADAALLLEGRGGEATAGSGAQPPVAAGRDPARATWPLAAGAPIAVAYVNEHRRAFARGERAW